MKIKEVVDEIQNLSFNKLKKKTTLITRDDESKSSVVFAAWQTINSDNIGTLFPCKILPLINLKCNFLSSPRAMLLLRV